VAKEQIMRHIVFLTVFSSLMAGTGATAQEVRITTFKSDATFTLNGQTFTITRNQDTGATMQGEFARTSRACPPDCLQPMHAADGVVTAGELEVLAFLEQDVTDRRGLLLDTRAPEAFARGSIPGAVNVPFVTLGPENRFRDDILRALGATTAPNGTLDFTNAMSLTLFSGGAWSSDAPDAIEHLITAGYPAEKIYYYRGGIQAWIGVGLSVQFHQTPG